MPEERIVFGNPCSSIREYCYSGENCIGTHNKYVDNLVNGNGSGIVLLVGSPTGTQTGAPAFVSYNPTGSGKYDLQATSPAIDKGTSVNAPAIDIVGGKRPQGAAFDIGAYEHGAAPGTWPWF